MTQRDIQGRFLAGGVLQLRPTAAHKDILCCDLSVTPLGGSIGGGFGSTLMSGAVRFEGALQVVHVPKLPFACEVTIDDSATHRPLAGANTQPNQRGV